MGVWAEGEEEAEKKAVDRAMEELLLVGKVEGWKARGGKEHNVGREGMDD